MARWTTRDPADQFADITPYGAMANNPIVYNDPDGRFLPVAVGIAALIGGGINLGVKIAMVKFMIFGKGSPPLV